LDRQGPFPGPIELIARKKVVEPNAKSWSRDDLNTDTEYFGSPPDVWICVCEKEM
jgi:hypothetical protein